MDLRDVVERLEKFIDVKFEECHKQLETFQDGMEEIMKKQNEVFKKKNEEFRNMMKKKNEELKMVVKEKNEDLEKVMKEKNEEVEKVMKEKNEKLEKVMKEMNKKLEEERWKLEELEDTISVLLIKERQSNDEIQEARKELIRGLRDLSGQRSATIGIKRMGEVDKNAFLKVCKRRFGGERVALEQAMLCSKWQKTLKDPAWYPFKRVRTGEKMKEVVDEEDEKLKNLREDLGKEAENAVKKALVELNEFNPCGRYTVPVLWNFEQERKATLKEGIADLTKEIKTLKRKLP